MDWMQYWQRIIVMRLKFCCESFAPFLCMLDKRRMQRILKLLTWCSCSCVYKLSGWLIGFKQSKHVFFPAFYSKWAQNAKPCRTPARLWGWKTNLCSRNQNDIILDMIFWYHSLSSSNQVMLLRLLSRIFTNWDMLRQHIETPKEQLVKTSPSTFKLQTSHFQAAKLQRVPPEQFGPWSFNRHLHWHRTSSDRPFFPQNPESINIQDKSRCVCLRLFLNSRFFGHISGFLDMVKNGWNEIEANPEHCSVLTEWISFR